jgi:hypothetical protein
MTSFKQINANRRNAVKSTGPTSPEGKQRSRCNAVHHGLTAETVIGALEDAEDYKAFEAAITADYDAQSAVERDLVLRLASLLWRLRRATMMETCLFEIQAEHLNGFRQARQLQCQSSEMARVTQLWPKTLAPESSGDLDQFESGPEGMPSSESGAPVNANTEFARCFLRLANLPNWALDRLSRYEARLWRQAAQIVFTLSALDRRKPQERRPQYHLGSCQEDRGLGERLFSRQKPRCPT